MTKIQLISILRKYATVPNSKGTKMFISEDSIPEIAGKIMELNKNSFTPPTQEEVKEFVKSKGYNEDCAIKAWEYYEAMNWKDNNSKPVKSWKAKIIAVWFREEFKIQQPKSGGMVY